MPAASATAARPTCGGLRATIVGTDGDDRLVGTRHRDVIAAGDGDDTVLGRGGNDVICGDEGQDRLEGGPGDDRLLGGLDNLHPHGEDPCVRGDQLDGGGGDDLLDPGVDNRGSHDGCGRLEQLRFRHGSGGVRVDLGAGRATGQGHDRLVVVQPIAVVGSDRADTVIGTERDELFDLRRGDDTLLAGAGRDTVLEGRAANGNDVYDTGEGRDEVFTNRGRDVVRLGADDDLLIANNPARMDVDGGSGADEISRYAAPDQEQLSGGDGPDRLMVVLAEGPGDAAVLDIPAGHLTVDGHAVLVAQFESWIFNAARSLDVTGSDQSESVTAWGRDDDSAVLTASMGEGDDRVVSDGGDDHVDGGPGTDYADLGAGSNTCDAVEDGPC